jgi:NADH:ubiquinone oxidoreductase subunit F (NADH-binding)
VTARRLLAATERGPLGPAAHRDVHGAVPAGGPQLIEQVRRAGLRGRGGAGFPTAEKLRAVAAQRGPRHVLVNAAEGDPMSGKDRHLLHVAPHLVLDGAIVAAQAVGARTITIAVPQDAATALDAVRHAAGDRRDAPPIEVRPVPVAYLAGEESALIGHLDGGPLRPTVVPPFPSRRGLGRRPTLVQNPETLAHLALIARHGPEWFREAGTAAAPGTTLLTLSGAVARHGVYEVELGTPLDAALALAGGATETLRALLVGGHHGAWIDAAARSALTLDDASLGSAGASLGAGIVVALGRSACPVQELAQGLGWLARQSAHQCGPCHHGLPALTGLLTAIAAGRPAPATPALLARWSADVTGRGACHLPDGAARVVRSGLRVFGEELADHARHGPCAACRRPTTIPIPATATRRAA